MIKKHSRTHALAMVAPMTETEQEVGIFLRSLTWSDPMSKTLELNLQEGFPNFNFQVRPSKVVLTAAELGRLLEEEPARVEEYESSGTSDVWRTFRMLSVDGEPAGFAR